MSQPFSFLVTSSYGRKSPVNIPRHVPPTTNASTEILRCRDSDASGGLGRGFCVSFEGCEVGYFRRMLKERFTQTNLHPQAVGSYRPGTST